MESFRGTIMRGYELSEKQTGFMNQLFDQAARVEREGVWQPSPELRVKADFAWSILSTRNSVWKDTHRGTTYATERYDAWRKDPEKNDIDEWIVNKMLEGCGPAIRELEKPKFQEGEMVTVSGWNWNSVSGLGVVCSGPVALNGKVAYEVLLDGRPVACPTDTIKRVK